MSLHLADLLNTFSKLNLSRCTNAFKVLTSYYVSKWIGKPMQWGLPFSIAIEPTTACNLACPECPSGLKSFSRPTGNLKEEFFKETIEALCKELVFLIFYFQGEPYIHPDFLKMVRYAHNKNLYTITSTNGHFLNEENARKTVESGLDRLIISVDGTSQEVYEQYRKKGQLEVVLQGARNVVKWKKSLQSKTPHLIFQFLVVRPNEHQAGEIFRLGKEIGIDEIKIKTAQIYDYKNGHPLIPRRKKYSRYEEQADGTYEIRNKLLNHCWKLWHSCVITWDGCVVPCCFDKDAGHSLGDLKKQGMKELWKGEAYRRFREDLFRGRKEIDICTNCSEGCKVWIKCG